MHNGRAAAWHDPGQADGSLLRHDEGCEIWKEQTGTGCPHLDGRKEKQEQSGKILRIGRRL